MEYNVHEISNAVMIDSLDTIIHQESWKLEKDKNTGLLAQTSKLLKVTSQHFAFIVFKNLVLVDLIVLKITV